MSKTLRSLAIMSLIVIGASAARAQDSSMYDLPIQQSMERMELSNLLNNMMAITGTDDAADTGTSQNRTSQRRNSQGRGAQPGQQNQTRAAERRRLLNDSSRSTTFRPLAAYLAPSAMAKKYGKTPAERARMEQLFTKDLDNFIAQQRRVGGNPYDLARVMEALVEFDYMIATDNKLSRAQAVGLLGQMRELVLLDNDVQKMSDRDRQFTYEQYAISTVAAMIQYEQSLDNKDTRTQEKAKRNARRRLQLVLGVPIERIKFTAQGAQFK